jgi:hypothetical protein
MKIVTKPQKSVALDLNQQIKAVLRGGTFNRVQVLLQQGQEYLEHCGLNYKVTNQKDARGRIICIWCN